MRELNVTTGSFLGFDGSPTDPFQVFADLLADMPGGMLELVVIQFDYIQRDTLVNTDWNRLNKIIAAVIWASESTLTTPRVKIRILSRTMFVEEAEIGAIDHSIEVLKTSMKELVATRMVEIEKWSPRRQY